MAAPPSLLTNKLLFVGIAAVGYATLVHAFFDAAFGDEAVLHCHQQFVKHVYGLVDEGDAKIGNLFIVHLPYLVGIVFLYLLATGIFPHLLVARVLAVPRLQVILINLSNSSRPYRIACQNSQPFLLASSTQGAAKDLAR